MTIEAGHYDVKCDETKHNENSGSVTLTFNVNSDPIRKIIKYENDNHLNNLLSLSGKGCKITVASYSGGKEKRITKIKIPDGAGWKTLFAKNKKATVTKEPKREDIPSKLLKMEQKVLGENSITVPDFLYRDLPQFNLVDRFFEDFDSYIRIFCSKYTFIQRKNARGHNEYIVDVPICDRLFSIAKRRCDSKCERFEKSDPKEINDVLMNEIQGVIGEETKVKFFNSLWEFLSIEKRILVNESIYDSSGDGGTDFLIGMFDVDVKQRNRPPNSDILLNKDNIDLRTIILLVTCLNNHSSKYYHDLYNFSDYLMAPSNKLVHQSVLTGYTDSFNYNKYCHLWDSKKAKKRKKYVLDYFRIMPMDDYIKLMIIEALKEEIVCG
jgi:hypothetical protein